MAKYNDIIPYSNCTLSDRLLSETSSIFLDYQLKNYLNSLNKSTVERTRRVYWRNDLFHIYDKKKHQDTQVRRVINMILVLNFLIHPLCFGGVYIMLSCIALCPFVVLSGNSESDSRSTSTECKLFNLFIKTEILF